VAVEIRSYAADEAIGLADAVWPCYQAVFGDFEDYPEWNREMFARHAARDGYRLVLAQADGLVAGFSWGYVGQRGQFWADLVWDALPGDVAGEWVGGHFEFVELAVLPRYRRCGLGRQLHDALLAGVTRRCLLSTTADRTDAAVRLYLSNGWTQLGLLRPGVQVLGLDLRGDGG